MNFIIFSYEIFIGQGTLKCHRCFTALVFSSEIRVMITDVPEETFLTNIKKVASQSVIFLSTFELLPADLNTVFPYPGMANSLEAFMLNLRSNSAAK